MSKRKADVFVELIPMGDTLWLYTQAASYCKGQPPTTGQEGYSPRPALRFKLS